MTLVVATSINGVPVILGDILISSQHDPGRLIALPTRSDAGNLLPPGYSVATVRRKVVILHDRLAVAWAGRQIGAQRVIRDLRRWLQETDLDRDRLFAFLDGYEDLGSGARCELVGWIVDGRGPTAFYWNMPDVWAGHEEYITGSGKEDFTAHVKGARENFYTSQDLSPTARVVHICLALAGFGIGREVLSGDSLAHLYGGGMEVALFTEGRFSMLTDITFLFWRVEFDARLRESRIAHVPTELKFLHVNDCLVVRTRRIDERGQQEGRIHVVTHVDQDDATSWVPSFPRFVSGKSKYYCNCLVGRVPGHADIAGSLVLQEPNDLVRFTQDIVDGKVEEERLEVNDDLLRRLHQVLDGMIRGPL
jgi:hypothetical protein